MQVLPLPREDGEVVSERRLKWYKEEENITTSKREEYNNIQFLDMKVAIGSNFVETMNSCPVRCTWITLLPIF